MNDTFSVSHIYSCVRCKQPLTLCIFIMMHIKVYFDRRDLENVIHYLQLSILLTTNNTFVNEFMIMYNCYLCNKQVFFTIFDHTYRIRFTFSFCFERGKINCACNVSQIMCSSQTAINPIHFTFLRIEYVI